MLPPAALLDEATFPVAGDRSFVELEYAQLDLVQVHLVEGETKQGHHGIRPVAVRPVRLIAYHDAQRRVPVLGRSVMQAAHADVHAVLRLDCETDFRVAVSLL